jgi:phospholipase C
MTRESLRRIARLLSRRRTLQGMGAAVVAAGCGKDGGAGDGTEGGESSEGGSSTTTTTGSTGPADGSSEGAGSESTGAPPMSDCSASSDLTPEQLLAPIDVIVVVCMENRSFDHYFGALSLVEGREIDGLTGDESNPGEGGAPVAPFPIGDDFITEFDPPHGWDASHLQWNDGANDGFVVEYAADGAPDPTHVMGYYTREQLPIYYSLADNYALCERYFCSVMGPTWPNRFHLHLATSNGKMSNEATGADLPSIFDRCTDAGVTNVYYNAGLPFVALYGKTEGVEPVESFFDAAAAGTLPQFCIVEPVLTIFPTQGANDDHPPADVRMGQAFIASVYQALAQSPQWDRCLLVVTYDEHGGFFDHVPPPTTVDPNPGFEQLGFRVPTMVIGPFVRRGCAVSTQLDHVSIVSTVTRRFGLEPLNERVTATNDLSSCIDPTFLDDPQPPSPLPPMRVKRPRPRAIASDEAVAQKELVAYFDAHPLPPALDRRTELDAIAQRVLAAGVRLGAVELVD